MRPYDYSIDIMIIDFLYTRVKTTYGELKRALECEIRKRKGTITSISPDTFSDRLRNMTTSDPKLSRYRVVPLLNKEDKGRGKIVIYWLTDKARKRYALKLPLIKIDSDREIAYQLLFYYLQPDLNRSILSYDTISKYTFKSEEEFHTFLSRIYE